ncbi:MAG TPA: alpha/beta hydrolase [Thermomicrobiales bacterium]|nr:alpha/beta hydrolase [Thermomicrobiales bacterium]
MARAREDGAAVVGEAAGDLFSIPATISPEAQAFLRTAFGRSQRDGRRWPDPADRAAWRAVWEEREAERQPLVDDALAQFKPVVDETTLAGVPPFDLRPRTWRNDGSLLVYLHGGAYVVCSACSTLNVAAAMAEATGTRVVSIDYPLAPAGRWRQVSDEICRAVSALAEAGTPLGRMAIWGDSADGALAAATALRLRNEGRGLPAALLLWSPWSDIAPIGDSYATLAAEEPLYVYEQVLARAALAYAEPDDWTHPYVSPVYGDFSLGFAPTLIQAGTKETFLSNAVRLYRALDLAGVPATLDVWEGMWHVFQSELALPEAMQARRKAAAFLRRWLDRKAAPR